MLVLLLNFLAFGLCLLCVTTSVIGVFIILYYGFLSLLLKRTPWWIFVEWTRSCPCGLRPALQVMSPVSPFLLPPSSLRRVDHPPFHSQQGTSACLSALCDRSRQYVRTSLWPASSVRFACKSHPTVSSFPLLWSFHSLSIPQGILFASDEYFYFQVWGMTVMTFFFASSGALNIYMHFCRV